MSIQITDQGQPLSTEQVDSCERELGAHFPEPYRQFLLANNGGVPHPNVVDIEHLAGTPTDVQEFFGIGLEIETSNISWYLHEVPERVPKNAVPIACDSGGNLFCLVPAGDVMYVDLAGDQPETHRVADSFDGFLAKIR